MPEGVKRFSTTFRTIHLNLGGMSAERNCPRKTFESIRKRFEKRGKKVRKTIRNATENCLAPLRPLKNTSPALLKKIKKVLHRPKFAQKKVFFSPRGSAGVATLNLKSESLDRLPFKSGRHSLKIPLAQNQYMQGKQSWGINFCANAFGACIRTRENTGKYSVEESFLEYFAKFVGESTSVRIHASPVFAPAHTGKKSRQIIYALVWCQGVCSQRYKLHPHKVERQNRGEKLV